MDDAIDFHKLVGHAMAALALLHTGAFLVAYRMGHARAGLAQVLFFTAHGITGLLLLVVLAIMWIFALSPIRRSSRFELFYFTLRLASPMPAYIDGPYGSPSAHIFESRYAVFIGAGIGVTPAPRLSAWKSPAK